MYSVIPGATPYLSLSIGVVQPDAARCRSHHEIAVLATDAKRQAKRLPGNALFIDRRQGVTHETPKPGASAADA